MSNNICSGLRSCVFRTYNPDMGDCRICAKYTEKSFQGVESLEIDKKCKLKEKNPIKFSPINHLGEHLALRDFIKGCYQRKYSDDKGRGYYATNCQQTNIEVFPSMINCVVEHEYSYIIWFPNK